MGLAHSPRIVTDGLVLALDAGNSLRGYKTDNNLLDLSTWYVGATSVTGFGFNGASSENALIADTDPFGNTAVIWKAYNPGGDADGGWNTNYIDVDHTKLYRFSVWVNRKVTGTDGSFYFGTRGYNDSLSNVGVLYRSDGTNETNPYFYFTYQPPTEEQLPEDQWVLVVGHVWPSGSGTGSDKPETGVYNTDGTKRTITTGPSYIPKDFVWNTTVTKTAHRTYLYYSENDANVIQHWAYPRIDLVDGTEPSIDDLINNRVNDRYWYDLSGQGNDGTLLNGVGYSGDNLGSLSFDGVDDYVTLPAGFSNFPSGLTISAFVNFGNASFWERIIDFGNGQGNNNILLARNSTTTTLTFEIYNNNTTFGKCNATNAILNNTIAQYVVTINGTTCSIYRNGSLLQDFSYSYLPVNVVRNNCYIGRSNWAADDYFESSMNNIMLYNRALTASEIQQNFNALRGRFGI